MTEEVIARVDAWLASRESWWMSTADRYSLITLWRVLADYRAESTRHAGIESAMAGVLLALVREAWGARDMDISILSDGATMILIQPHEDSFGESEVCFRADSLGTALLAALEASPQ